MNAAFIVTLDLQPDELPMLNEIALDIADVLESAGEQVVTVVPFQRPVTAPTAATGGFAPPPTPTL